MNTIEKYLGLDVYQDTTVITVANGCCLREARLYEKIARGD